MRRKIIVDSEDVTVTQVKNGANICKDRVMYCPVAIVIINKIAHAESPGSCNKWM